MLQTLPHCSFIPFCRLRGGVPGSALEALAQGSLCGAGLMLKRQMRRDCTRFPLQFPTAVMRQPDALSRPCKLCGGNHTHWSKSARAAHTRHLPVAPASRLVGSGGWAAGAAATHAGSPGAPRLSAACLACIGAPLSLGCLAAAARGPSALHASRLLPRQARKPQTSVS